MRQSGSDTEQHSHPPHNMDTRSDQGKRRDCNSAGDIGTLSYASFALFENVHLSICGKTRSHVTSYAQDG